MSLGAEILTAFIAAVSQLVKATGSPHRQLTVRVPNLAHCALQGLDVQQWCRAGLVDVLVAENSDGNLCDPQWDFRPAVAAAAGT